jgi:hypothetical protein
LDHITLQDILIRKPQILSPLLRHASESLRSLYINGLPQTGSYNDLQFPHLPNLQYLRLEEFSRPSPFRLGTVSLDFSDNKYSWLIRHSGG